MKMLLVLLLALTLHACAADAAAQAEAATLADTAAQGEESAAGELTISELVQMPEHLNGAEVIVSGEVVGDKINAGSNHVWITLSDGSNAITVFAPRELEQKIEYYGKYAQDGTQLKLQGVFSFACAVHDGAGDIHATALIEVIEPGGLRESTLSKTHLALGGAGIAAAVGLMALYSYVSRKKR
ncbi:MAG: hypothetical protein FWD27_01840 [Coriobacteriia bacterium]|nr:hypothetical protein [Coriobacteriia bacterium]